MATIQNVGYLQPDLSVSIYFTNFLFNNTKPLSIQHLNYLE